MIESGPKIQLTIPDSVLDKWQDIVNLMAEMAGVPAGLIMRIAGPDIEVFVSSRSEGNPYHPGHKEHLFGSGLYCETVIKTKNKLLVPDALSDDNWKDNPDIKLNMISYLGFPILLPDGEPFGTICVLDTKENRYSETYAQLMVHLRDIIQGHLDLLFMNHVLGEDNKQLRDYIAEIQTLRAILPICAQCKKIRDDQGYWQAVENYFSEHRGTTFSHTICPDCARDLYPPDLIDGLFEGTEKSPSGRSR
ncbi:MAG: GAF domain-containing protein [Desulfomonilaceae bacterium]|nr:GAF domain-containing protein [Desulfomonilaceae bacterium]